MDHFIYNQGRLFAEDVDLEGIAERFGTPCYVYSRATIERHWRAFDTAFSSVDHLICYSVKANSNLAVLNLLARLGSGFDIVSLGELERVVAAGGDPGKVVFSGVGKRADEIRAALKMGIFCFNVESRQELVRLDQIATEMNCSAPVALRINPDVDAHTHPHISTGLKENKFGIDIGEARQLYRFADTLPNIDLQGIDCHIGSQLTDTTPYLDAMERLLRLVDSLMDEGITFRHIDIGGGLGITYRDERPPLPGDYAAALLEALGERDLRVVIEPGRAIVGNAGVLLTRVEYLKHGEEKNFAIVDSGMNDLIRPALYNAWQEIIPVIPRQGDQTLYDVVGPICESSDFLGKDRTLNLQGGDLLAVRSAGAYCASLGSNYNSRPRAAEVMVDGHGVHLIRDRERLSDLFAQERLLPE